MTQFFFIYSIRSYYSYVISTSQLDHEHLVKFPHSMNPGSTHLTFQLSEFYISTQPCQARCANTLQVNTSGCKDTGGANKQHPEPTINQAETRMHLAWHKQCANCLGVTKCRCQLTYIVLRVLTQNTHTSSHTCTHTYIHMYTQTRTHTHTHCVQTCICI